MTKLIPIYCFLISHEDRHIIFDLGIRTDWEKAATVVSDCTRDLVDILHDPVDHHSALGIRSSDIEAIIWSHPHFDHTGDQSQFPHTTELVVRPGVKGSSWPGYPSNPDGLVLDSDAAGRSVHEIHFDHDNPLRVGPFNAVDCFGDGFLFLLDAPVTLWATCVASLAQPLTHPPLSSWARVDACHHAGVLRPSPHLPLPRPQAEAEGNCHDSRLQVDNYGSCLGDLLE
ncbi:hypothetical protein BO79DRAFT_217181 [Aspergillus costaricaensis CBS 115574]|uniref:Uncharacterized protein n=1 Tax=Aspergillus costaricaensis CBS 115574 TaxID=1448317 RepID=A0ACD1IFI9_9EURO|nr:hypothetical protein BO79DRAFT_217181 [Aspergillus costaricaensis CBS 115574]RAK89088.1 hypothetical protein BO79DRAFT_217181 [Aspergillus costaricaensis CBS 115574]